MTRFRTSTELLQFAEKLVRTRVESLERDGAYCLKEEPYAPFPALLYCFATIDLLGALAGGNAHRFSPTNQQAAHYMQQFMHYSVEQVRLLQTIFRHKLVHLASPKAVIADNGRMISWAYDHDDSQRHLKLCKLPQPRSIAIGSPSWTVDFDHEFEISIVHLVRAVRGFRAWAKRVSGNASGQHKSSGAVQESGGRYL